MAVYSFIASLLFILVETRAATYDNVELKFGKNTIIIPLKNPIHVTQINGLNFADLNLPVPNLMELILQSRALPTMPPPQLRRSLPPDLAIEDNSETDSQPENYPNSNRTSQHTAKSRKQGSSTPKQSSVDNEESDESDSYTNISQKANDRTEDHPIKLNDMYDNENSQYKDKKSYGESQTDDSALTRYLKLYGHQIPVYLTTGNTDEEVASIHRQSPATEGETLHSTHKLSENPVHPMYASEEDDFSSDLISKYLKNKVKSTRKTDKVKNSQYKDKKSYGESQTDDSALTRYNQSHIKSNHTPVLRKDIVRLHTTNITNEIPSNSAEEAVTSLPVTTSVEDTEDATNLRTTLKLKETTSDKLNTAVSLADNTTLHPTTIKNGKNTVGNTTKKVNSNPKLTSTEDEVTLYEAHILEEDISEHNADTPTAPSTKYITTNKDLSKQRNYISGDRRVPTIGDLMIPSSEEDTTPLAKDVTLDTKSIKLTRVSNSINRPAHYTTSELTSTPFVGERIETTSLQYTPDDITSTGLPATSEGPNIITDAVEISSRPLYTTVNDFTLTYASTETSTLVPTFVVLDTTTESFKISTLLQNTTARSSALNSSTDLPAQDTTEVFLTASSSRRVKSDVFETTTSAITTTTVLLSKDTLDDLNVHKHYTNAPESSSLVQYTTSSPTYISTDAPMKDTTEISISSLATEISTDAPKTSSFIRNKTTVSSSLRTTTSLPKQYKSTKTPGPSSSVSHMATNAAQTSPSVQNTNPTKSVTNDNTTTTSRLNSPTRTTAATVTPLSVRNITASATTSSPRPQPSNATNTKKKEVAKARRKSNRAPCKHQKKKGSGHKGKSGTGGGRRRRRRKTTPAARRTTQRSTTQRSITQRSTTQRSPTQGSNFSRPGSTPSNSKGSIAISSTTTQRSLTSGSTSTSTNSTNINSTTTQNTTTNKTMA